MTEAITKTQPLPDGSILWCIHFKGSYHDDDERMPGNVPVDVHIFVLAKDLDEAILKASSLQAVKDASKRSTNELLVDATIVKIESLIPARDCSKDGRLGYYSISPITQVGLPHPDDAAKWKLAVCLVPLK